MTNKTNYLKNTIAAGAFVAATLLGTSALAAEGKTEDTLYTDSNNTEEAAETTDADTNTIDNLIDEDQLIESIESDTDSGDNFEPDSEESSSTSYTSQDDEDMPEDLSDESTLDKEAKTELKTQDAKSATTVTLSHTNGETVDLVKKINSSVVATSKQKEVLKLSLELLTNVYCATIDNNTVEFTQKGGAGCKASVDENPRLNKAYTAINPSTLSNMLMYDNASAKLLGKKVLEAQNSDVEIDLDKVEVIRNSKGLILNIVYLGNKNLSGVGTDVSNSVEWNKDTTVTVPASNYILAIFNHGFNKGLSQKDADGLIKILEDSGQLKYINSQLESDLGHIAEMYTKLLQSSENDGKIIGTLGQKLQDSITASKRYLHGMSVEGGATVSPDGNVGGGVGVGYNLFDTKKGVGLDLGLVFDYFKQSGSSQSTDDNGNPTELTNNETIKLYSLLFEPSLTFGNKTVQGVIGGSVGPYFTEINNRGTSQIGSTVYNNDNKETGISAGGKVGFKLFPNAGSFGIGLNVGYNRLFNASNGINPNRFKCTINLTYRPKSKK